jgi:hypothetical protein
MCYLDTTRRFVSYKKEQKYDYDENYKEAIVTASTTTEATKATSHVNPSRN